MKIRFLKLDEVLDSHAELIKEFSGLPGILNKGLLESALDQPKISSKYSDQIFRPRSA